MRYARNLWYRVKYNLFGNVVLPRELHNLHCELVISKLRERSDKDSEARRRVSVMDARLRLLENEMEQERAKGNYTRSDVMREVINRIKVD